MLNILNLSPWPLGGSTSYVVNLSKTLTISGVPNRIVRLSKNTEKRKRQLGSYGVWYQNVSYESAIKGKGVWLLAGAPTDETLSAQALDLVDRSKGACVFHDPNEFKLYPHWHLADRNRVICIRETGLDSMPAGTFIPHPYVRVAANEQKATRTGAVSIARISAVKNSLWILEANEKLPADKRVVLAGALNRFWWNFTVKPKHPDWLMPEGSGFVREADAAVKACAGYQYMIDLTIFPNDGGGTQYSFLEAMDAGAVPVMTSNWCSYKGVASQLGFQVDDKEGLLNFLLDDSPATRKATEALRLRNYAYLDTAHEPARIAKRYVDFLKP